MIKIKTHKDPSERIVIPFDFVRGLSGVETLSAVVSVTISVVSPGVDASAAAMLPGTHTISGTQVLVPVRSGVSGVQYDIECLVDTSNANKRLAITGRLTVREGA